MDEEICYASIEEVPDTTGSFVKVASDIKEENIAVIPRLSCKEFCPPRPLPFARLQVPPRIVLYYHLYLLRHVPALIVTSRALQLKMRAATIEEIEHTAETLAVQAVSESSEETSQVDAEVEDTCSVQAMSSIEEKMELAAIDEFVLSFSTLEGVVEDATDTTIVEAVKSSAEEKVKAVNAAQESAPTYEEFDWDRAPSYEEFANDASPEPLFEKRFISLEHAVHRPPPLAILAARTGAKASSHPRASRLPLPLLDRLSSRLSNISGTPAEPVAAA
ncbi:hypothetical protein DFH09DRAFT_1208632 [Mycena vulgaris]|nr:hypothetical protein DFH09DRAFT_1208632 [Mycena vulgaris]